MKAAENLPINIHCKTQVPCMNHFNRICNPLKLLIQTLMTCEVEQEDKAEAAWTQKEIILWRCSHYTINGRMNNEKQIEKSDVRFSCLFPGFADKGNDCQQLLYGQVGEDQPQYIRKQLIPVSKLTLLFFHLIFVQVKKVIIKSQQERRRIKGQGLPYITFLAAWIIMQTLNTKEEDQATIYIYT